MASRKCYFRHLWLQDAEYASWLQEVKDDKCKAFCTASRKTFDISNMGIGAVKSRTHQDEIGGLQQASTTQRPITGFFQRSSAAASTSTNAALVADTQSSQPTGPATYHGPTTSQAAATDDILRAEVMWALKVVMSHYSFNSCQNVNELFSTMFPDNPIAKAFTCSSTKCSYLVCFGLAPYFHEKLIDSARHAPCYTVSFDECLNKVSQNEQMDFVIRFWDSADDKVAVRYLGSEFLGHATAADLLKHFNRGIAQLDPKNLLQVSMDGPNVNQKFHQDLVKERQAEELPGILNIGSYGLHSVHGSLQTGANKTGWNLGNLLRALWQIFPDSPARRDDFTKMTESSQYPLQFCVHRWVEDVEVAEHALLMWPAVEKFVASFQDKQAPSTVSFTTVKATC